MILSDASIRKRIQDGNIKVNPTPEEVQFQPVSLDLRLGDSYTNEHIGEEFNNCHIIEFEPETLHLAHTLETLYLPDDVCALITGRSSLARNGLFFPPILVDPGFKGQITLQAYNLSESTISLPPEKRFAQITFMKVDQPVDEPYGKQDEAKYQDQKGPTKSREDL